MLTLLIIIFLSGCFREIEDKMEIITGNFESEIIEEEIYTVGTLTKVNLVIIEINKEEYDSLDANKFMGWLHKDKYYKITLEVLIDGKLEEQELTFKGRGAEIPDLYKFTTYLNRPSNSIIIAPTINEEITGYKMSIVATQTSIRHILLYHKNT
jgi:hypothetical protein